MLRGDLKFAEVIGAFGLIMIELPFDATRRIEVAEGLSLFQPLLA